MISYGQTVTWTNFFGSTSTVKVTDCASLADARAKALEIAIECGWTPPRWWQWWRWADQPRRAAP